MRQTDISISFLCGVFLIPTPCALTPNKFRTADSQREKDGFDFFQRSDDLYPGWLGGKRERLTLCFAPPPPFL